MPNSPKKLHEGEQHLIKMYKITSLEDQNYLSGSLTQNPIIKDTQQSIIHNLQINPRGIKRPLPTTSTVTKFSDSSKHTKRHKLVFSENTNVLSIDTDNNKQIDFSDKGTQGSIIKDTDTSKNISDETRIAYQNNYQQKDVSYDAQNTINTTTHILSNQEDIDLQTNILSSVTSDEKDQSNTETRNCFFTSEDLKKYMPKEIYDRNINNDEANLKFLEKIKELNLDQEPILDEVQQEMISIIGKKIFPKKFKPYLFRLNQNDHLDFIHSQLYLYRRFIIDSHVKGTCNIPVLIPNYICIDKNDSLDVIKQKIEALMDLKIYYISYISLYVSIEDDKELIVICPDKIDNKNTPAIFVFIPNELFDKNMKLTNRISYFSIIPKLYYMCDDYKQFKFGFYKFYINNYLDSHLFKRDTEIRKKHKAIHKENLNNQIIIQELERLKEKVRYKLEGVQSLFLNHNLQYNPGLSKEQLKGYVNTNTQKLRVSFKKSPCENIFSNIQKNKEIFINIENKLIEKYKQEKYQQAINGNENITKQLISKCNFRTSELPNMLNTDDFIKIKNNLNKDIKRLKINSKNSLVKCKNVVVLIPMKHYLFQENDYSQEVQKEIDLARSEKLRYNCVYLSKTKTQLIDSDPENSRIVVALTQNINVTNPYMEDKIIILICNDPISKYNKSENINLFDPNKFVIKGYFYQNVNKYYNEVGYPLYEFFVHPKYNMKYSDNDDYKKYYIEDKTRDIDKMSLVEYLGQAYTEFDKRVVSRAKECQKRSRETRNIGLT